MDGETGDFTRINLFKAGKVFHVEAATDAVLNYVTLPGINRQLMVIADPGNGIGTGTAKGISSNVDVGGGRSTGLRSFCPCAGATSIPIWTTARIIMWSLPAHSVSIP